MTRAHDTPNRISADNTLGRIVPDFRPTRHIRISPALPVMDYLILIGVAMVVGFWLAIGVS